MKIIDYEIVHNLPRLYKSKLVVYGTGVYGHKLVKILSDMKIEISLFIETEPLKEVFCNIKVISLERFLKRHDYEDFLVIIASENYHDEMIYNLKDYNNIFVCTYYAVFVALFLNYQNLDYKIKNKISLFLKASMDHAVNKFMDINCTSYIYSDILSNPEKVLVYQPGKVGSQTICNSSLFRTSHTHSMAYLFGINKRNRDLYMEILSNIKKNPIKIITGVREPISRDISAFFQDSEINIYPLFRQHNGLLNLYGDYYRDLNQELDYSTVEKKLYLWESSLNKSFDRMCKIIMKNRADEFSWFDYEIKALFDIDIFEYPFDKERGFTIIENENVKILVYKCEKLNELEETIGEFIGESSFQFCNSNEGKNKIYSYIYKEFREKVVINPEYFDYYYKNDKWMKHFYTELEIENFVQKWKSKFGD